MDHLIVYDTETAGLTLEEGVVEHAWIEIDDEGTVLEEVYSLIKPPGAISPSAAGVHGITLEDVKDAPTMDEFMINVRGDAFRNKKVLLIAHNVSFDLKYIAPYCGEVDTLCTLKLARLAFPEAENHKLPTLMFYLGLVKKGTHNALDDVYTCYQLLEKCGEKLDMTLEQMYELVKKPVKVTVMPWGKKYKKGTPLVDLPKDYINWCLNLPDLDESLRWSLEEELKSRKKPQ